MTEELNPIGKSITDTIKEWYELPDTKCATLRFSKHSSPWESLEYGVSTADRNRRVWINDYPGQQFIEVRFMRTDITPSHSQRFHFMISDERRVIEEIIAFILNGTLPLHNPAKKQYVAYLSTPEAKVRKEAIANRREAKEKEAAENATNKADQLEKFNAMETDAMRAQKKREQAAAHKVVEPTSKLVFTSPAPVEMVPAWKKALNKMSSAFAKPETVETAHE